MKADKLIAATRNKKSIVIEVKRFLQPSFIHEFLAACGPYKFLLAEKGQTEEIYMAISDEVYQREFHGEAVQVLLKRFGIQLLIVNIEKKVIIQWIE